MELYHNQVTRTQGAFSLRMFHRSWGLMMIQANIAAPCVVLDFPVLDRFIEEIRTRQYDVIGITSIIPNMFKVKKMCELIRQYQPDAVIVIGGHIANVPDLGERIDADYIVKGEGVRWFRQYLGEDANQPVSRYPTRQFHAASTAISSSFTKCYWMSIGIAAASSKWRLVTSSTLLRNYCHVSASVKIACPSARAT